RLLCRRCMRGQMGHLKSMSQRQLSPETLDLFGAPPPSPRRRTGPARPASAPPRRASRLSHMSDGELALLLSDLVREVQRRTDHNRGRKPAPDWDRAVREVPSGRWLECEGGVISGLFNEP